MTEQFSRTALIVGEENMERLHKARVAVFGVGGVGGYTVEALARSGIGTLDLVDNDTVCLSNLNRQIIALHSTIGKYKVDVAKERILDINPEAQVNVYKTFFLPETAEQFDFTQYDYVVDAIDTVTGKLALAELAKKHNIPIISAMGAGNKLNPAAFEVTDISKTSVCPLAKVMRRELKKRGIYHLKVVYSKEEALTPKPLSLLDTVQNTENASGTGGAEYKAVKRRQTPGSMAFVPSVAGLIIAGEVIRDLMQEA